MAFVKIRGAQIQNGAIVNAHIDANAAIHETKLDIDWAAKSSTILAEKKVVDFVQVNNSAVGGLDKFDLTGASIIPNTQASTSSASTDVEGVIVSGTKNVAPIRDSVTGDPILANSNGDEVYGRVVFINNAPVSVTGETLGGTVDGVNTTFTFANKNIVAGSETIYFGTTVQDPSTYTMDNVNGTVTFATAPASGTVITADYQHDQDGAGKYELGFFYFDTTLSTPAESVFTMPAGQEIDWQYAQRFNLDSVNEMFAANEKFVAGAADATAHLNIEQLAKDIYGSTFSLDRDGAANLTRSLVDEIKLQTSGLTNTTVRANTIIDEVVSARGTYSDLNGRLSAIDQNRIDGDKAIRDDLASQLTGKGASLVGIEDSGAVFTATTVEGALNELEGRLATQESGGGAEVEATHTRDAATTNGYYALATFASLEARLVDIENIADAEFKKAADTTSEVVTARGTFANLDARLDDVDTKISDHETRITAAEGELADVDSRDAASTNGYFAEKSGLNATTKFANLEERLVDIETVVDAKAKVADDGATELSNARSRDAASANAYFAIATFTDIEGRFVDVETVLDAKAKITDDNKAEIEAARKSTALTGVEVAHTTLDARLEATDTQVKKNQDEIEGARTGVLKTGAANTFTSLDGRLDEMDARDAQSETRMQTIEDNAIENFKYVYSATGGESVVSLPTGQYYKMGDDSLDVYVNGILQVGGVHYVEVEDSTAVGSNKGVSVDFAPDTFISGDYVTLRYTKAKGF